MASCRDFVERRRARRKAGRDSSSRVWRGPWPTSRTCECSSQMIVEADADCAVRRVMRRATERIEEALAEALGGDDPRGRARPGSGSYLGPRPLSILTRPAPNASRTRAYLSWLVGASAGPKPIKLLSDGRALSLKEEAEGLLCLRFRHCRGVALRLGALYASGRPAAHEHSSRDGAYVYNTRCGHYAVLVAGITGPWIWRAGRHALAPIGGNAADARPGPVRRRDPRRRRLDDSSLKDSTTTS